MADRARTYERGHGASGKALVSKSGSDAVKEVDGGRGARYLPSGKTGKGKPSPGVASRFGKASRAEIVLQTEPSPG